MKLFKDTTLVGLLALSLVGGMQSGCKKDTSTGSGMGTITILATDAPFPYENIVHAFIRVEKIEIRKAGGENFIVVSTTSHDLDLVDLRNGVTNTLASIQVPTGSYDQVRLVISQASVDLTDGRHMPADVPSGAQSGLKVNVNPSIQVISQLSNDLLLDFDISQSFIFQGPANNPHGVSFKPVIRAANLTTAGTLSGTVLSDLGTPNVTSDDLPLENAIVSISLNGNLIVSTVTEDGHYKVLGLQAGQYDVTIASSTHTPTSYAAILINAGNVTTLNSTLAATAPSPAP